MENESRFFRIWAVGAAMLIAAILTAAVFLTEKDVPRYFAQGLIPEALGVATAHLLLYGAMISIGVWAVLHFGFVRWTAPESTTAYYLMILGTVIVVCAASLGFTYWAVTHAVARAGDNERAASQELDQAFAGLGGHGPIDMRVRAKGEAGAVERAARQFAAADRDAAKAYTEALKALDYPAIVSAKRLAASHGLSVALVRLDKARDAVKAYGRRMNANIEQFRASLKAAAIPAERKGALIREFNAKIAGTGDANARVLASEDAILGEYEDLAADLKHARGRWLADGAKMRFADPVDLNTYRSHMQNIQRTAREERAVQSGVRR